MKDLWFRVLVVWYRLTGSTATQARWRARESLGAPQRARGQLDTHFERARDERFTCVCGQLLVKGDRTCPRCGRRQWVPTWLRRVGRMLGLTNVSPQAGTTLALVSMLVGFAAQLRYGGDGAFMRGGSTQSMLELGAALPDLLFTSQPWRAFTYTMLHGGIMHLAFNGIALFQIGPLVERWVGFGRFWLAWVLTGVAGVMLPPLVGYQHQVVVIGASGAVSGLIGMAMMLGHRAGSPQGRAIRDAMIKWMVYVTIFGLMMGGVAHDAHFAGFAAGAALAWLVPPVEGRPGRRRLTPALVTVGLGIPVAAITAFALWFFQPEEARFETMLPSDQRVVLQELRLDPPHGTALDELVDRGVALTEDLGPGLRGHYLMAMQDRLPPTAQLRFNQRVVPLIQAGKVPGLGVK